MLLFREFNTTLMLTVTRNWLRCKVSYSDPGSRGHKVQANINPSWPVLAVVIALFWVVRQEWGEYRGNGDEPLSAVSVTLCKCDGTGANRRWCRHWHQLRAHSSVGAQEGNPVSKITHCLRTSICAPRTCSPECRWAVKQWHPRITWNIFINTMT